MRDANFREQLEDMRRETLRRTTDALLQAALSAVHTLTDLTAEGSAPAGVRRAAARDILEQASKMREQYDLSVRVDDLALRLCE